MEIRVALIGFGEAAGAFCAGGERAYDLMVDDPVSREAKLAEYRAKGIDGRDSVAEAVSGASVILSLVTADQALVAAQAAARHLAKGALWIDMNSVAPETKLAAARAIHGAGGRYADAAIMAPVRPGGRSVPVLLSGPHAAEALEALRTMGFTDARVVAGPVGAAASIKMIRSVMVKGIEALSAECALAAEAAGVTEEVFASLDASWRTQGWAERVAYNLERMARHGGRRAAEMGEVVKTLDALGTGSAMSRATAERQRVMGAAGLDALAPAPRREQAA